MKIRSVRISNILSFEEKANIELAQEIIFDKNLSILIGANGAGKSNFLEVIKRILTLLSVPYVFNYGILLANRSGNPTVPLARVLEPTHQMHFDLRKNRHGKGNRRQVRLRVEFSENDLKNVLFIKQNSARICELARKYSMFSEVMLFENSNVAVSELTSVKEITVGLDSSEDDKPNIYCIPTDDAHNYFSTYLRYFRFLQDLIQIAREYENNTWVQLKNTFAFIGSLRNYNEINLSYQVQDNREEQTKNLRSRFDRESTRSSDNAPPLVFDLVKEKLSYRLNAIENDLLQANPEDRRAIEVLEEDPLFSNLAKLLESHLRVKLSMKKDSPTSLTYSMHFDDLTGARVSPSEFSAGEKAILHLIFSLYGYDLEGGLLIIDEPEIHLHPTIQSKYLGVIQEVNKQFNLQLILATHSPIFITADTLEGVYRFYTINGFTSVVIPHVTEEQKDLVRILNYTNSSKIFFVNKVILVEGVSDEYFYRFYLDRTSLSRQSKAFVDIEILDIRGKGEYRLWRDFLRSYKIKSHFIGDWDSITNPETGIIQGDLANKLNKEWGDYNKQERSRNNAKISLRNFVELKKPAEFERIQAAIPLKYAEGIYILKQGELEDYIGRRYKSSKIKNAVEFCKDSFDKWNSTQSDFSTEIDAIFQQIAAD